MMTGVTQLQKTQSSCPQNRRQVYFLPRTAQLILIITIRGCIQKFSDWPPGARTANGTVLCHYVQLHRYFMSQYSEFCSYNPLRCFSTSVFRCKRIFRYRLSPETFGYTLVQLNHGSWVSTVTRLQAGRQSFDSWQGLGCFSLRQRAQAGSRAHPDSCSIGTGGSFPGSKAAGLWSWPLSSM
jgi:hypothetical protein